MRIFTALTGLMAPLPETNVDTDKVLPAQFLKIMSREGLGEKLFYAVRFHADGSENPDFILNRTPWRHARILVTLDNFGCGSAREHAPWALANFGLRCVIAPSFSDIFYNNCFKNGMLPIVLPRTEIDRLLALASDPATAQAHIDLPSQTIKLHDNAALRFEIAAERKSALLTGLDEIDASLKHVSDIDAWETQSNVIAPSIPTEVA